MGRRREVRAGRLPWSGTADEANRSDGERVGEEGNGDKTPKFEMEEDEGAAVKGPKLDKFCSELGLA